MSLKKLISSYSKYNHWANEELTRWLTRLEEEILFKETPSSFNSIVLTLQHIVDSQNFWIAVITENNSKQVDETEKGNNLNMFINQLLTGSRLMLATFSAYSDEQLLQKMKQENLVQNRYEYILHVINHNSYHRGQIITMSRRLGVIDNIPNTDYDVFLWSMQK